jgi:hypothetical protein
VVVLVEQQGGQVEGAVTGQDGRVDVDHAGDRGAVGQQVGQGEVVVDEVVAVRDRRAAAVADPAQDGQQVTGGWAVSQGGVQAIPVAAGATEVVGVPGAL